MSEGYVGWKSSLVDPLKPMIETKKGKDENAKEWNFVLLKKMSDVLKPEDFADEALTRRLLDGSTGCSHVYKSWREIERTGPDPLSVFGDGLAVRTIRSLASPTEKPDRILPADVFYYRPKLHQDADGIFRRVEIVLARTNGDNSSELSDEQKKVLDALATGEKE